MSDQDVGIRFTNFGLEPTFPVGQAPKVTTQEKNS